MKYLKIKNVGLMQEEALTLVGASTKRNDSTKIGQFGSGNKYALAYFLRNNFEVKIFSGLENIEITTKPIKFRENDFRVIQVNGKDTSITTEMGKNWTLWQAIRETYCNAIDEGEPAIELVNELSPVENETHYYINTTPEIFEFLQNFDNYFSMNKKVLFENERGKILVKTGEKANIYRRGVRCYDTEVKSLYDYDLKDIEIDENRIVVRNWEIEKYVWEMIFKCENEEVILDVLHNSTKDNYIEAGVNDWVGYESLEMSDCFKYVITNNRIAPINQSGLLTIEEFNTFLVIPNKVYRKARAFLKDMNVAEKFKTTHNGAYRYDSMNHFQQETLEKAKEFLRECGYSYDYPIETITCSNPHTLAIAAEEKILITLKCLDLGVNETIEAIIEENIHLRYGCRDETREMQTAIIKELITYMSKINMEVR